MKTLILILALASTALAQQGTISQPDIFGNRTIRYNNGVSGQLSAPDIFGGQTLRYNNGTRIQYDAPDIFGNQRFRVHTMPRNNFYPY